MIGWSCHCNNVICDPATGRRSWSVNYHFDPANNMAPSMRLQLNRLTRRRKGLEWLADLISSTQVLHSDSLSLHRLADRGVLVGSPSPGSPWPGCRRAAVLECARWRSASSCTRGKPQDQPKLSHCSGMALLNISFKKNAHFMIKASNWTRVDRYVWK